MSNNLPPDARIVPRYSGFSCFYRLPCYSIDWNNENSEKQSI